MKTTDKQDIILQEYFKPYREKISDGGFTKNTLRKLPKTEPWFSKKDILISTTLIIGTILTLPCINILRSIISTHNIYTILFLVISVISIVLVIISAMDSENELI